jgi:hypothetical protein
MRDKVSHPYYENFHLEVVLVHMFMSTLIKLQSLTDTKYFLPHPSTAMDSQGSIPNRYNGTFSPHPSQLSSPYGLFNGY